MPSAREVYHAFDGHVDRQRKILDSVKVELTAVDREFEQAEKNAEKTIQGLFPTTDSLPLDVMTLASLSVQGKTRDFRHAVDALRTQDAENRAQRAELFEIFGDPAVLTKNAKDLESQIKSIKLKMGENANNREQMSSRLRDIGEILSPLEEFAQKTGIQITNKNYDEYATFSLSRWVTDATWRKGRDAVKSFDELAGRSPDELTKEAQKLSEKLASLDDHDKENTKEINTHSARKKSLDETVGRFAALDKSFMGEDKIYGVFVAHMIDLLQDEKAAQQIGNNLPPEQAQPLAAAALTFKNLQVIHDNLETLRGHAQKALKQVEDPMTKLGKLKRNRPSHQVKIDLNDISNKLGGFNDMAETYVGRSQKTRTTLARFNDRAGTSSSVSAQQDNNTNMFMAWMFYSMMMNDTATAAPADPSAPVPNLDNTPDFSAPTGTDVPTFAMPDATVPNLDLGADALPSFDGNISIPTIDVPTIEVPTIDIPTIDIGGGGGGYDGGGFSGGGFGGGCEISIDSPLIDFDNAPRHRGRKFGGRGRGPRLG